VAGVVDAAVRRLRAAGFSHEDARRDAVVLARGTLRWSLADWLSKAPEEAPPGFQQRFDTLVTRRESREPVAYLLGEKEFFGRTFTVTPDTLVPRPETEGLVEAALAWLKQRATRTAEPARVVDVGTGTGCVAITLALEAGAAHLSALTATDISAAALTVARANAMRLGAASIDFQQAHLLGDAARPAHLIVSNPPYVRAIDRDALPPDVRLFEPATALFAGDDGLDVIRELLPAARRALAPDGALLMEIGAGQADAVERLAAAHGFARIEFRPDLQGIPRVIIAS
jgi:release factor glutamine methyltransferase